MYKSSQLVDKSSGRANGGGFFGAYSVSMLAPFLLPHGVSALDTGWVTPTALHAPNDWDVNTVANVQTSNNTYATEAGGQTQGYSAFSLPAIAAGSTIDGIEVRVEAHSSDSSGCRLGIALSWDNGTSYSPYQYASLTGSDATTTLGDTTDTWGHAWTLAELSNANFVTQLLDDDPGASCVDSATVSVDLLQVRVSYTAPRPDLTITKTNNVGDVAAIGQAFTWTLRVQNGGLGTATFYNNEEILRDDRPSATPYGAPTIVYSGTTGAIDCNESDSSGGIARRLTCEADGTVTMPAGSYIDVSFTATPAALGVLTNPRVDRYCHVDGDTTITESNEGNNNCSNSVVVKEKGHIVIKKTTKPSESTQKFTFTPDYGDPFTLTDGQSNDSGGLNSGTYSVLETALTGWDQSSATCDNGNPVGAIIVTPGTTVTCTFTNTQRGTIIVKKVTNPSTDTTTEFTFDPSYSETNFVLKNGGTNDSGFLQPGTYSVAELAKPGWGTTSATCSDGSPVSAIELSANETVTCTFTDTVLAQVLGDSTTTSNATTGGVGGGAVLASTGSRIAGVTFVAGGAIALALWVARVTKKRYIYER